MMDSALLWIISLGAVALFASAALHKLRSLRAFEATLAEYRLMPQGLVPLAAGGIVALECMTALGLLLGYMGPPRSYAMAATLGAALLLIYAAAMGVNLLRGRRDIDCGCTLHRRSIGGWMVARNVILAMILMLVTLPDSGRALSWIDSAVIAAALIVALLLYLSFDSLYSMETP